MKLATWGYTNNLMTADDEHMSMRKTPGIADVFGVMEYCVAGVSLLISAGKTSK